MLSIYTEYRMKIVQCPPIPTEMVKYNVGRLNYILSLAEAFSADHWVAAVLMLSQPEIMKVEYHGTDFNPLHLPSCSYVVAGSERRQSMPTSAEGSSGVSHSKSVARRTRCPSFYSKGQVVELMHRFYTFLFGDDLISQLHRCDAAYCLPNSGFCSSFGVSKLCCVAPPWLLALLSVVLLLSVQAGTEKELVTLSPILPY